MSVRILLMISVMFLAGCQDKMDCPLKIGDIVIAKIDEKRGQIVGIYAWSCTYAVRFPGVMKTYDTYDMTGNEIYGISE